MGKTKVPCWVLMLSASCIDGVSCSRGALKALYASFLLPPVVRISSFGGKILLHLDPALINDMAPQYLGRGYRLFC